MTHQVTDADLPHLRRCVELAAEAVEAGDFPFGSVLVAADGTALAEDRNREVTAGDPTRHPEFELARWAAANMTPSERAGATVYTSGEHCPMCAAAHGWVGLGRIVYVTSTGVGEQDHHDADRHAGAEVADGGAGAQPGQGGEGAGPQAPGDRGGDPEDAGQDRLGGR